VPSIIFVDVSSGTGKSCLVEYRFNPSLIDFSEAILLVSLDQARYQEYDTNHIVDSIAKIVITTINSTKVNPCLL
jgi:hypothetical protein